MGYPFGATCLPVVACSILPAHITPKDPTMSAPEPPSTSRSRITEGTVANVLANLIWVGLAGLYGLREARPMRFWLPLK